MTVNLKSLKTAHFAQIASLFVLIAASGGCKAAPPTDAIEILKDGNVRDLPPSKQQLNDFVAKANKNLVLIPGGKFEMGDWGEEVNSDGLPFDPNFDSKPLHEVTLDSYSMARHPVTYAEFDVFTAAIRLPRINQDQISLSYRKPDNPAGVSWQGANDYCEWLAKISGQKFSLPTEAQWEYAARSGGKRNLYATDNGRSEPGRNVPSHQQAKDAGGLVPVLSFPPNEAGIYHMGARIREWVIDWYGADYYRVSPEKNPRGPQTGAFRIVRGFVGSDASAMTITRWKRSGKGWTGSWTRYPTNPGEEKREVPVTRYSNNWGDAFRCVLNHSDSKLTPR